MKSKWEKGNYNSPFQQWKPPPLVYPVSDTEKDTLHALKAAFEPLPMYPDMERAAAEKNESVHVDISIPDGHIAFLENTAEKCISPQTKHSQEGMQGARHWVQRVDTPDNMFQRLTDGYGISLMFGERYHQYIRNSNNWHGASGMMLDLDVWYEQPGDLKKKLEADDRDADFIAKRLAENEKLPQPVYSFNELFDRYPLLPQICSFILPSASSLYGGRPFKSRGIILFPFPITDRRIYWALGDILLSELDCIPANVTKNPVAVGFGNTHNAPQGYRNSTFDVDWITDALQKAKDAALVSTKQRNTEQKKKAKRSEHYRKNGTGEGENIREFNNKCDAVGEMVREGLLTPGRGNEYRWHESEHERSCDILDGSIHIFSDSMFKASPHQNVNEAVGAHRFYLYQLTGQTLDMTRDADKPRIREFLFERGYGKDPKAFAQQQQSHRYTVNTEHEHDTRDMDTEREANKNSVVTWERDTAQKKGKHLLILGSAAGTGKTTVGIFTADALLYIAKTTEEADKVFQELDRQEEDVIRHRPRMFNRGHTDIDSNGDWDTLPLGLGEHERPCIQPELCNIHAERIGTPNAVCQRCHVSADCDSDGYLSQAEKERNTSKVVYAWGEVVACDERFAGRVKRICTADDILLVDEVNPLELTQRRLLDRETLFDLIARFRHPDESCVEIYRTLKSLKDILSTAETPEAFIAEIQQWIDSLEDINALDDKIERYPVGLVISNTTDTAEHEQPFEATLIFKDKEITLPVVDFETADDTPCFFVDPDTPIEIDKYHVRFLPLSFLLKAGIAVLDDPPCRYRKLLTDMKTFFDENTQGDLEVLTESGVDVVFNIDTAPFTFDPKNQTFEFHLKPTLNHRRTLFNTASDPDNLIGEAYRGTDIKITRHTGTSPPWKTDLVFQVSSGNYLPRHSLVKYGDDETLHLENRAQEFIDAYILPSIKSGLKTLVIAPKAFQEVKSVKHWAVTDIDDVTEGHNALLINHHHAEGRNDYQDFDIVFTFHYEPNHHEIQLAAKRIYRNPETPLDFTREKRIVTSGGVSFEKQTYTDERVQAVYNRECRGRLMQCDMRLRPNIHKEKIIVNLTAEPIDRPVTPIPFSLADKANFTGDWADFKAKLQAKATATATVQERINAGDSKSKAYRDAQDDLNQKKKARDAEIRHRYDNGNGQSKKRIAEELGISRDTVKRVLDINTTHTTSDGNSQPVISTSYSEMGKIVTPGKTVESCLDDESEATSVNGNGTSPSSERPHAEWQDDDYYSEHAIRERQHVARAALKESENAVESNIIDPLFDNFVVSNNEVEPPNLHTGDHTTEQKQEVNRLYHAGKSKAEIHQQTGVNPITIDTWLAENVF